MNSKGFTLIEMLGCLAILGIVLAIGLLVTRDTLSTSLSTLTDVSFKQIKDASELYVMENGVSWINVDNEEYTCITVKDLVDAGYFDKNDVVGYQDDYIKVVRISKTRVIDRVQILDECE